ncbi:AraC family transcriptional regulator [Lysinibacillus fusiformis]|nr:AraC family transcriptional regulator [Lysinibacillus fusiformis]QAS58256.1 AraC family transcriptional regulator [Lysinibacillus sphaericus]RDV31673.1 AraC family transcriptional regulator [Lysinibacillus fusiformis]HAU35030.1 AraC family transcriptional regulator [Lysinibacillus sp.]
MVNSMNVDFHQNFTQFFQALNVLKPQETSIHYMEFQSTMKEGAIHRFLPRTDLEVVISDYSFHQDYQMNILTTKPMVEISYCLQGTRRVHISNCEYRVKAGTCTLQLMESIEANFLFNKDESYQMVSIGIPVTTFNHYMKKINEYDGASSRFSRILRGSPYRLFQEKINPPDLLMVKQLLEAIAANQITNLQLESIALQLLTSTFQSFFPQSINPVEFSRDDRNKLFQAQAIMVENMMNPPSLMELSRLIGLNDFKLKKGFKEMYGTTVFGYLREKRLEQASLLLQNGTMNVMEVANAVGYSNPSHFAEVFKEKYGVSPRDFLKYRTQ